MYNFDYVKASSVADATAALGGDAQALSGGQTLIPTLKARLGMPTSLVDLSGIAEMSGITSNGDSVTIGGAVTHHAVNTSSDVPPALAALADFELVLTHVAAEFDVLSFREGSIKPWL